MVDKTENKELDAEEKTRLKATASDIKVDENTGVKPEMLNDSEHKTVLSTHESALDIKKEHSQAQSEDGKTKIIPRAHTKKTSQLLNSTTDNVENQTQGMDGQETRINPGAVLRNRFDLLEVIGQGGMGKVYKALDKRDIEAGDTKFIAIKIINDEYKDDTNLLRALHAETRKTQSLAHPNIVTVYDFDRDGDTVFMTMEYIEGIPLNKIIKAESRGMKVNDVYHLISQIGSALVYAHSRHIIHLDLKPSNVFMDANKNIKVFDFGISRVTNVFQAKGFDAGVLGGLTPSYASLEMFNGESPDPRDDIYALACITYELLTGRHPYNKEPADIVQKKKLVPQKINKLSASQWKALTQALALNRKDRTSSVELFLQGMATQKSTRSLSISVLLLAGLLSLSYYLYSQYEDSTGTESTEPPVVVNTTPKPKEIENDPIVIIEPKIPVAEASDDILLTTNQEVYRIGDKLVSEFMVKKPMFVSIVVINSEGKISMLFPNPFQLDNYCKVGVKYQIPPLDADFTINIEGPVGKDQVIAIMGDQTISEDLVTRFESWEQLKKHISQTGYTYAMTGYQITE